MLVSDATVWSVTLESSFTIVICLSYRPLEEHTHTYIYVCVCVCVCVGVEHTAVMLVSYYDEKMIIQNFKMLKKFY